MVAGKFVWIYSKGGEKWTPLYLKFVWLANTAIDQIFILLLDFTFSFSVGDFP